LTDGNRLAENRHRGRADAREDEMRCSKVVAILVVLAGLVGANAASAAAPTYGIGPVTDVSASCSGQNAEVEQAVDAKLGYVYETWMGCRGIGFARSTDGGLTFQTPTYVPDSTGSNYNSWDPAVAVAPDGTVYAAFMLSHARSGIPSSPPRSTTARRSRR
jgi:hypothetical protein